MIDESKAGLTLLPRETTPVECRRADSNAFSSPLAALVIDDEDAYRDLAADILTSLGWSVDKAWNGQVGWQMAQLRDYDLVVCDVVMPLQDGFETMQLIHDYAPRTCIVAMSGGGILHSDEYLQIARGFGADEIMAKPFGFYDLCRATRSVFRKRDAQSGAKFGGAAR